MWKIEKKKTIWVGIEKGLEDYEEDLNNDDDDNNDNGECYLVKKNNNNTKKCVLLGWKKEADRLKQSSMNGGGYLGSGV